MSFVLNVILRDALESFRTNGVLKTVRLAVPYLRGHLERAREEARHERWTGMDEKDGFDAKFGTETSGLVDIDDLGVSGESEDRASYYKPTLPRVFHEVMAQLPVRPEDFVFIDYGSGKARICLLASDQPFRKIVGVEFSPVLHEVAKRNLAIYRSEHQLCADIELLCLDAAEYLPPAGNLLCYFYYPFDEVLLSRVLERIKDAVARGGGVAWLLFVNPPDARAIEAAGIFEAAGATKRPARVDQWLNWSLYRTRS